jgi:cytidylate kinase
VQRVAQQQNIPAEEAEAVVAQGDKVRAAFVKDFYGASWEATSTFDLLINRGKISPDLAVEWLVQAARALEREEERIRPTTASIEVDGNLAAAIAEELERRTTHGR